MNDDLVSRSWLLEQLDGLGDTKLIKRNFVYSEEEGIL